jgi:hypothetical protein
MGTLSNRGERPWRQGFGIALLALILAGCQQQAVKPEVVRCDVPAGFDLEAAIAKTRADMAKGCEHSFDGYTDALFQIAETDPRPENKRIFSDYFLWAHDADLIGKRQAQTRYTRHFGQKFVSAMGDFNSCSQTCPAKEQVIRDMQAELRDKERGLLKISADREGYYRADRLFQEMELVLEATCAACTATP